MSLETDIVPQIGPLIPGRVYQRKELNRRFGGSRYSGIINSPKEPVILLFHTAEKSQQFYQDGYSHEEGIYWYSGQGTLRDMKWNHANQSIRDHNQNGRDIYLFERAQRKDGLWRLYGLAKYIGHKEEARPDKTGAQRKAIIFALLPLFQNADALPTDLPASIPSSNRQPDIKTLRIKAQAFANSLPGKKLSIKAVFDRSAIVKQYALIRSEGICEACGSKAPFCSHDGRPFLEVHHINRLADEGLDDIKTVAAICPNCHRRCHYSGDSKIYNNSLREKISDKEMNEI